MSLSHAQERCDAAEQIVVHLEVFPHQAVDRQQEVVALERQHLQDVLSDALPIQVQRGQLTDGRGDLIGIVARNHARR